MQSQQAPTRTADDEKKKRHGRRQSAGGTKDTSAQGSSGAQPPDAYRRYHRHRNDAGNRQAPQAHSDRGPGPSPSRNGGVRQRQEHQPESRKEHRRDHSARHSVGPKHGHTPDGSDRPTNGNEAQSGTGPRRGRERARGSAPRPEKSPEQRHRVRPGPSKDGLKPQQLQAERRPSPKADSDSGHGPYNSRNGRVGRRQEHRPDSRMEQRRARSPQHSVGRRHGQKQDDSVGPTNGNPPQSGTGPTRGSERPRGSAPRPERSPDRRHRVRPVPSKDGLKHRQLQAVRRPSPKPDSDSGHGPSNCRNDGMGKRQERRPDSRTEQRRAYQTSPDTYKRYHWHRNDAGNRPSPQTRSDRGPGPSHSCNSGVRQREEHQPESRREHRRAYHREHSAGPSQGRKTDGSVRPTHENQPDSGVGPRRGTGRPPGSAPWPENIPDGRHPVWAVPGKDWLILLPNTVEPMELDPPEDVEEAMEVDPPPPEQTWDSRSMSLLSALQAHKQHRRSARPAPYSLSRRLHPKH
ncbi:serine/arginine repetitive matrix protein 1-like [Anser cygnoides]|uniref:serine/arginine repetitive matrix protein 1-like n=1 Tax=Anser cygnoides TaxID=8845 RepID=UPI0034D39071